MALGRYFTEVAKLTAEEVQGNSHLINLQHIYHAQAAASWQVAISFKTLADMPSLTSLDNAIVLVDSAMLTRLRALRLSPS